MAIMRNVKGSYTTENNGSVVVLAPKGLGHTDSTAFDTNHTIVPAIKHVSGG